MEALEYPLDTQPFVYPFTNIPKYQLFTSIEELRSYLLLDFQYRSLGESDGGD